MRRPSFALAAVVLAYAATGCSDQITAPDADAPALSGAPSPAIIVTYMSPDEDVADFVVTPSGGYFGIGRHGLHIPANAICDPSLSTYGITEWDKPCTPLREPIAIHAELRHEDGGFRVDFTPELRFVPSRGAKGWVTLYMSTDAARKPHGHGDDHDDDGHGDDGEGYGRGGSGKSSRLEILWSPAPGVPGIDESLTDHTLKTHYDKKRGIAWRRIKHFSGYQVHDGRSSELSELEIY